MQVEGREVRSKFTDEESTAERQVQITKHTSDKTIGVIIKDI